MQDFGVKNAKIFWGGLSPPQTPPNNEEGDTPSSNSSPQCREGSNFLSFIPPHQTILDPSLLPCDHPTMMELCDAADTKLFAAILP